MSFKFRDEMQKPNRLAGGHRMCAGCGAPVVVRSITRALHEDEKAVVGCATGCLEVSTFMYPYTAWKDSFIHSAFENASATISGVVAAYDAQKKDGKIDDTYRFMAFGGDGGTYDIGFQSLSGAMERGTDFTYICYDNGAYMNTGVQRSSATPKFTNTTTTPVGTESYGKEQRRKDLTKIMVAHNIPYVAQTLPMGNFKDMDTKARRAHDTRGAAFLNVLAPCPTGWRYPPEELMELCQLAVDTCYWPLFEVIDGEYKLNYKPKEKLPVYKFLEKQGRFRHLFKDGNQHLIDEIQANVDRDWEELLRLCGEED